VLALSVKAELHEHRPALGGEKQRKRPPFFGREGEG
jgi:hypothetical protein